MIRVAFKMQDFVKKIDVLLHRKCNFMALQPKRAEVISADGPPPRRKKKFETSRVLVLLLPRCTSQVNPKFSPQPRIHENFRKIEICGKVNFW
jgi:hypothetical protein